MSDESDSEAVVDPRVEQITDMLLELIGEVIKVTILITELPEDNVQYVLPRFNALVSAVNSVEFEENTDPRNFGKNVGEA